MNMNEIVLESSSAASWPTIVMLTILGLAMVLGVVLVHFQVLPGAIEGVMFVVSGVLVAMVTGGILGNVIQNERIAAIETFIEVDSGLSGVVIEGTEFTGVSAGGVVSTGVVVKRESGSLFYYLDCDSRESVPACQT